jgi:hypothetical protein
MIKKLFLLLDKEFFISYLSEKIDNFVNCQHLQESSNNFQLRSTISFLMVVPEYHHRKDYPAYQDDLKILRGWRECRANCRENHQLGYPPERLSEKV